MPEVEHAITDLLPRLGPSPKRGVLEPRWLAIKLLEGDARRRGPRRGRGLAEAERMPSAGVDAQRTKICDILIADSRYGFANALMRDTVRRRGVVDRTLSDASTRWCCTGFSASRSSWR